MAQVLLPKDRHIPDGVYLDHETLVKKVVDLKSLQLNLRMQQAGLEAETESYERSTSQLKQNFNIIAAAAEVAGWGLEPDAIDSSKSVKNDAAGLAGQINATAAPISSAEDLRLKDMDEILELQVLSEEIRACLPKLESMALHLEAQIYDIDKATESALAAQKQLPPLLNKSAEELEVEMGTTIEKKIVYKTMMAQQVEAFRKEKINAMVSKVALLREQLSLAAEERDVLRNGFTDSHMQKLSENAKVRALKVAIKKSKEAFNTYHGPTGWAVEAWLYAQEQRGGSINTADDSFTIQEHEVIDVLAPWVSDPTTSLFSNRTKINQILRELGPPKPLDQRRFVFLCSTLAAEEDKQHE